uniref:CCHC-type domain-containing protein n=1 Tax=Tanacetum cinerariifolium TaxID=118510 RepID=A0A699HW11_TANCI|nr:hypothetical protein [Tanacetum cinerariifolium]
MVGIDGQNVGNQNGNDNVVAARVEGNAIGNNDNQIRCYNCRGLGHLARNYIVKPKRRDASYLLTQLLIAQKEEKASTSGTQTDNAPVYDSDGSAEVNDVTRLQALVDKKKVVVTEVAIREVLQLNDVEGVDCLPNEDIFAELARMGYEKLSTKLTFYKAFFSSQCKFLIHTILQSMSAKRTSWNKFSSAMTSAVICLSTGIKFNFSKYIFEILVRNIDSTSKFYMYPRIIQLLIRKQVGDLSTHTIKYTSPVLIQKMLIEQEIKEGGDTEEHVQDVTNDDAAQGDDTAAYGEVPTVSQEPSIPSPTLPTPLPQPPQDLPSTSQALKIKKLKRRVKKLEKGNRVKVLKLRRLKRVGTSKRVDTSEDTVMDDSSNQGKIIDEMDKDDVVALMDDKEEDKEEDKKEEEAKVVEDDQEDEPAEVQEVVDVVTTDKLITEVVTTAITAASTRRMKEVVIMDLEEELTTYLVILADTKSKDKCKGIIVEEPKPLKKKQQVEIDEEYARKLHAELKKDIDWDAAIDHNVAGFRLDYFKGMSYDDIRLIFEVKFNSNMDILLKTKEQMEKEESRALQSINEIPAQKAAKRRKLNEEVEDLKRHLEIVLDEDDDVYTEATPLARKVPIVDYEIINLNNKPYYKII